MEVNPGFGGINTGDLFSGIIVMTALYSVNLRIAGMKANLPFLSQDTIFDNEWTRNSLPASVRPYIVVIILAVITLITIPVIIIYALFSKQIVEGVTSTGSKEG